jgi:hypothetical protein
MLSRFDWRGRARAASIHLLVSAAVAAFAAALVFGVWYPGAFRELAGGRELFVLVTSVDVVLGPLLTFSVFNVAKGWRHLRWDLAIIGAIQTAALVYGLHTVYIVRPVAMVFESDRLRLLTPLDVNLGELPKAAPQYRELSLTGPLLLGTREPQTPAEHTDALMMGLKGIDIGQRPIFWQPYELSRNAVVARSKPLSQLLEHYPRRAADIREQLKSVGADETTSRFIPVMARGDWIAVLDPSGAVLGYLPFDGFF